MKDFMECVERSRAKARKTERRILKGVAILSWGDNRAVSSNH